MPAIKEVTARKIPDVTPHDTPLRWPIYHGQFTEYLLMSRMSDTHLLNAIMWAIRLKGHKIKKLPALVKTAVRRRLPLPEHKWVVVPAGYATFGIGALAGDKKDSGKVIDEPTGIYNPADRD
jgi:hypothetical protein